MNGPFKESKVSEAKSSEAKSFEAKSSEAKLADQVRRAADVARRLTLAYPRGSRRDDFPFAVVAAFDAEIRGRVERDRRIEDERDRVLIAAVNFAETPADDEPEAVEPARRALLAAIDYLEEATLRFGIVNREGERAGYGEAGQRVTVPA